MSSAQGPVGIVLDSSCVIGTPRPALEVLKRRGFRIHISGLALEELAVHLAPSAATNETERKKIRSRMVFLAELAGGVPLIAPTHTSLVDKLGGHVIGLGVVPYGPWLRQMQGAWTELAGGGPLSQEVAAFAERMKEYVEETGRDFVETLEKAAELFGEPTPQNRAVAAMLPKGTFSVIRRVRLPGGVSPPDRFDAFLRLFDLHGERAHARFIRRRPAHEPNHAIDLNLLHHLADGLIVVTKDLDLIEEVDASGTVQAPWVRTVGELLLGMAPVGDPFTDQANGEALRHTPRTREDLLRWDKEGNAAAVADLSPAGG